MMRMITIAGFVIIAACTSVPNSTFCDISRPIRLSPSAVDAMSDAEVASVLSHNEKLRALCGVKP